MDPQMKKGVLEMCILFQLKEDFIYGYEIMKRTRDLFPDVYESSIYSILRRLYADGYTEINYGNESFGPKRKYYKISEQGILYLEKCINEWKQINQAAAKLGINL